MVDIPHLADATKGWEPIPIAMSLVGTSETIPSLSHFLLTANLSGIDLILVENRHGKRRVVDSDQSRKFNVLRFRPE